MAIRSPYIKKGYVTFRDDPGKDLDGGFSLLKFLKHWLKYLNVQTYDACCDTSTTVRPLRYNVTSGRAEYYNGTAWVVTSIPTAPTATDTLRYSATSPSLTQRWNGTAWVDIPITT